jgi:hypothetical protein
MPTGTDKRSKRRIAVWRAAIEISGIIFLFYSNLLMGEFNHGNGHGKTLMFALRDIVTRKNLAIALVSSCLGFAVFEYFRKRLDQAERSE